MNVKLESAGPEELIAYVARVLAEADMIDADTLPEPSRLVFKKMRATLSLVLIRTTLREV
jgi:hypothetical protein